MMVYFYNFAGMNLDEYKEKRRKIKYNKLMEISLLKGERDSIDFIECEVFD